MEDIAGKLYIPKILLLLLHRLRYKVFVQKVTLANKGAKIGVKRMRNLWSDTIGQLYSYEEESAFEKTLDAGQWLYIHTVLLSLPLYLSRLTSLETRTTVRWSKIYSKAHKVIKMVPEGIQLHLTKAER